MTRCTPPVSRPPRGATRYRIKKTHIAKNVGKGLFRELLIEKKGVGGAAAAAAT